MSRGAQLEVVGAKELRKTLKAAGDDLGDLKAAHAQVAAMVTPEGQSRAPVGATGRLSGSVRGSGTKTMAVVRAGGAAVPYAGPIHWGWPARGITADPFLSDAATATEAAWTDLYGTAVQELVDKAVAAHAKTTGI